MSNTFGTLTFKQNNKVNGILAMTSNGIVELVDTIKPKNIISQKIIVQGGKSVEGSLQDQTSKDFNSNTARHIYVQRDIADKEDPTNNPRLDAFATNGSAASIAPSPMFNNL